jgi:PAS domain S-box-containing protein
MSERQPTDPPADGDPARTIASLRDEVRRLAELLDMAQDFGRFGVWERDVHTMRGRWDPHMFRLWGHTDAAGTPDFDVATRTVVDEDREALERVFAQSMLEPGRYSHRYRVRAPDGSLRRVHSKWAVRAAADGRPERVLGVAIDDTETWQLARSHDRTAEQLALAVDLAGIGSWRNDLATGILTISAKARDILGLPPERSELAADELMTLVHPHDVAVTQAAIEQATRTGEPADAVVRIVRPDGSLRHVLTRRMLKRDATGEPLAMVGVGIDLTKQLTAEAALRHASERVMLATHGAGMGTWERDFVSGRTTWDEQMWLLRGLPPQADPPTFEHRLALVHPDDRAAVNTELDRAVAEDRPCSYEFRVRRSDGEWRWLASRSVPLHDSRGQPSGRIGVNFDVSDARSAQRAREERAIALRESQAKSQFLSRMSHELRTPLNAVLGFSQLLLADDDRVDAAERRRRLHHIESAGQHLLSLINDVLDLSSLEGGELPMAVEPVPLRALVNDSLALVEALAQRHRVNLHCGALTAVPLADATRLRQVLLNLLSNAVKYNRDGGDVHIGAEDDGGTVRLHVTDTGVGMSAEQLEHVFEPFTRLGREAGGIDGTGIGLAIVKALVEHMGGAVQLRSSVGVGTRFEVSLPAAPIPAVPAARAAAPAPTAPLRTADRAGSAPAAPDDDAGAIEYASWLRRIQTAGA